MRVLHNLSASLLILVCLSACTTQEPPAAPSADAIAAAKAQMEAKAEQHYAMYEQMIQADNAELALPLGDELIRMYPDSAAAARVRPEIEKLREKANTEGEARRMARLWTYQTSPMAGGTQSTATVYSNDDPSVAGDKVRLVFRRHTEWGQSVFLYGSEPGFTCAKNCRITMSFDGGKPMTMEGSIPPTGEPAIFIEEDKKFIAQVEKSKKVDIEVHDKGKSTRTLHFDVGGFDAKKFLPLPKK
ncbi:MAG TPA: hypothetical protein VFN25_13405 [Dokdonella sp.]|uniref:hypothetical protein n=1 Tax=Dokdonella sp. TaxID=2291710 RepID=UPI002D7E43F4|nr:hypothetical protein [Dokdonella sp.]HET9033885.1 hypothetical protein [Dokdonella sp.]